MAGIRRSRLSRSRVFAGLAFCESAVQYTRTMSRLGIPCCDGKRADASKGRAIGAPASQAQAAQNRCACCTILKGAPWPMVSARDTFRPRTRDTKVMFAVTYGDGRSAYIRVDPETARHGNLVVMDIARERQEAGEIPGGTILSVKQVR
jgi:hypothetical protein